MSIAKHAPGPWAAGTAEDEAGRGIIAVTIDGGRSGFEVAEPPFSKADWANARLIAAAPDLLAALKMLRDIDDAYGFDLSEQQRDQMHDALAKAEGRS